MARGSKPGERRGGRKPGTPNSKTVQSKELHAKAIAEGISPLEVMLYNMRWAHNQARTLRERNNEDAAAEVIVQIGGLTKLAQEAAKDAAPYVHPKLTSIEHKGDAENPIAFENVNQTDLARRLALLLTQATEKK